MLFNEFHGKYISHKMSENHVTRYLASVLVKLISCVVLVTLNSAIEGLCTQRWTSVHATISVFIVGHHHVVERDHWIRIELYSLIYFNNSIIPWQFWFVIKSSNNMTRLYLYIILRIVAPTWLQKDKYAELTNECIFPFQIHLCHAI